MARDDPEIRIRIPAQLKAELEAAAAAAGRTLTGEVLLRLQNTPSDLYDRLRELEEYVGDKRYGNEALERRLLDVEQHLFPDRFELD